MFLKLKTPNNKIAKTLKLKLFHNTSLIKRHINNRSIITQKSSKVHMKHELNLHSVRKML